MEINREEVKEEVLKIGKWTRFVFMFLYAFVLNFVISVSIGLAFIQFLFFLFTSCVSEAFWVRKSCNSRSTSAGISCCPGFSSFYWDGHYHVLSGRFCHKNSKMLLRQRNANIYSNAWWWSYIWEELSP